MENNEKNQINPNEIDQKPQEQSFLYPGAYPFYGYPLRGQREPWYDDKKDYNTNAPSYYDYLASKNYITRLTVDLLNRVARRNIRVVDTNTVDLTKEHDWIQEGDCAGKYSDVIDLKADVKISALTENETIGTRDANKKAYTFPNAIKAKEDGIYARDTTKVLADLFDMADDLNNKIANEIIERINADKDLKGRIQAEQNNREKADRDMLELINQKYADLLKRLNDLLADQGKLTNALTKIINNLQDSGAWSGGLNGQFNNGRNIATGNINLFSSTVDGDYFIRTNNGRSENDLAGGV